MIVIELLLREKNGFLEKNKQTTNNKSRGKGTRR